MLEAIIENYLVACKDLKSKTGNLEVAPDLEISIENTMPDKGGPHFKLGMYFWTLGSFLWPA